MGAFTELGATGRQQWGSMVRVETDPKLMGLTGMNKFDEIRRTDQTGAAMYLALTLPIRGVRWSCEPGGPTPADEAAAEFAWSCFDDMSTSFGDVIGDACTMFTFGWSYLEMVLKRRSGRGSLYDDGRVGFKKIALRPQRTLARWDIADDGDIKGLVQLTSAGGQVEIPLDRSLLFRTSREGDDPEGISIYRPAVRPYTYRRRLEQVEGIGLYRRWAGFPEVKLPPGATSRADVAEGEVSDEQRAEELVQAIYEDRMMGAYLPDGWELTLGGPEGNVDATMGETIIRKDAEMARAILAQFLLLGLKTVGTQALAQTLLESFTLSLEAYLGVMRDEFNRYAIPYLFRYNQFTGLTALPTLQHTSPRSLDLTALSRFIGVLAGRGMLTADETTEGFLRSLVPGMPPAPEWEEEEEEEPAISLEEEGGEEEGEEPDEEPDKDQAHSPGPSRLSMGGVATFRVGDDIKPPPGQRAAVYHAMADENAEAQRSNLETWTNATAVEVSGLSEETTEAEMRDLLDDLIMVGLLMFRERSMLDIAAAFWLGFGKSSGGPEQLMVLQREVAVADSWLGYDVDGTLRRTNPAGKLTLFGDIAGSLEGRIAALLLLLKQGRRDDVLLEITGGVRGVTNGYSRGAQYSGHVWHALWEGVYERERYDEVTGVGLAQAVRWVLDILAKHCKQCLEFGDDPPGREYPSFDAMLVYTSDIKPGVGTDCNGWCRCHLERLEGGVWVWA